MRIHLSSIFVDDQDKALQFYTEILGFEKKEEVPVGEYRWLTLGAPGESDGTQLVLEPDAHPAVKPFKDALVDARREAAVGKPAQSSMSIRTTRPSRSSYTCTTRPSLRTSP